MVVASWDLAAGGRHGARAVATSFHPYQQVGDRVLAGNDVRF